MPSFVSPPPYESDANSSRRRLYYVREVVDRDLVDDDVVVDGEYSQLGTVTYLQPVPQRPPPPQPQSPNTTAVTTSRSALRT